MVAVAGVQGDVLITTPPSVGTGTITFTDSGDHATYNIATTSKRYLDMSLAPTVQTSTDSGVTWNTISPTLYTLRYLSAQIVFAPPLTAGTQVRILTGSANYFPYGSIGNTTEWQFQGTRSMADATTLKGSGGTYAKDFLPLLLEGMFTLKQWWFNQTLVGYLTAGTLLIISVVAPAGGRYEGYVYMKDDHAKIVQNALVTEDLTFQITGQIAII